MPNPSQNRPARQLSQSPRNIRRRQRHNQLIELGYSPAEARRLRDNSGERIEADIDRTEQRLRRVPVEDRSPNVQARLRLIRDFRRRLRTEPAETRRVVESRPERISNWSEWSKFRRFPTGILREIERINRERRFDLNSSYGFRIFFHMYVNGESESLSRRRFNSERFERRDT